MVLKYINNDAKIRQGMSFYKRNKSLNIKYKYKYKKINRNEIIKIE